MPPLLNLALNPLDATSLLQAFGAFATVGTGVVMFAETGLLIGFFLPGDSLLFTAGLLCTTSKHGIHLNLAGVLIAAILGALMGAQVGYVIGQRGGKALLHRSRNKHLHRGAIRAEEILDQYGHAKAVLIGRFIPVVRTVLNPMAGALNVPVRIFTVWQVIGGLVWTIGVTLAGYALGSSIPSIDTYLLPIIAVIVVLSLIPVALEILRTRKNGTAPAATPPQAGAAGGESTGPATSTAESTTTDTRQ